VRFQTQRKVYADMKILLWFGPLMALALPGCASSDRLVGRPDLQVVPGTEFPAPTQSSANYGIRPYVVAPSDKLNIVVFGASELSRTVVIDPNGQIALPLVGTIEAAGKTPAELSALVASRLRRYVRDPQVEINPDTINQSVVVEGEVRLPGSFPVTTRMTLLGAVARAQGLTEAANTNYVVVFRRIGQQDMAALYDLRAIRQGVYPDPEIYANDTVSVGESRARRVFQLAFQTAALLTAPLVAVINR
jgi:polysaccharide export outer membrane protein